MYAYLLKLRLYWVSEDFSLMVIYVKMKLAEFKNK